MSFTDENLKRLKECIPKQDVTGGLTISYQQWKALLARLEAAENNMRGHAGICARWFVKKQTDMKYIRTVCVCGKKDTEKAWRKAAGK